MSDTATDDTATTTTTETGDGAATDTTATTTTDATAQTATSTDAAAQAAAEKVEDLPEWAQKIIRDTRKEAADNRAGKQAEAERVKAILKAAGIETEDDDPVKALETTKAERDQIAQELYDHKVEKATSAAAKRAGADEDLVVAVLASKGKLDGLDITADDLDAKLDALVKAAVDANPKLKATQAAAASGVDGAGGSGEKPTGGNSVDDYRKQLYPSKS